MSVGIVGIDTLLADLYWIYSDKLCAWRLCMGGRMVRTYKRQRIRAMELEGLSMAASLRARFDIVLCIFRVVASEASSIANGRPLSGRESG